MSKWKYIDEYKELPGDKFIFCDTRDFHIITTDDGKVPQKLFNLISKEPDLDDYSFNRSEILGALKTLEQGTGGKGDWRQISIPKTCWLKYVRFIRTPMKVELVGRTEPVYIAYCECADDFELLSRTDLDPDNVNKEFLNFIEQ